MRDPWDLPSAVGSEMTEANYADSRRTDRTYISRSFVLKFPPASRDFGQLARYIRKVFDEPDANEITNTVNLEWTTDTVFSTTSGRRQVEVQIAREAGAVRKLRIQQVRRQKAGMEPELETLLELDRDGAQRFIDFIRLIEHIPIDGDTTSNIDDETIRAVLADPSLVQQAYANDPVVVRKLIEHDESADDVMAIAKRRSVLAEFHELLTDVDAFEAARVSYSVPRKEDVWQKFFDANPWLLGVGLAGHLFTSWDETRLEQVVTGASIGGVGKRADALMRTNGAIQAMVFAEFKTHETELVETNPYRSGCYAPTRELTGGVTQVQQTVFRAVQHLGSFLPDKDEDGSDLPTGTHLLMPRAFLIVGRLESLLGTSGGVHRDKFQSFELYRRNLTSPEILTFDELFQKASWLAEPSGH